MKCFVGRFVKLEELNTHNQMRLHEIMIENERDYVENVFHEEVPKKYSDFCNLISSWFANGREFQFLAFDKITNQIIGTIFFYRKRHETVKMSVYFIKKYRKSVKIAEAMGAALLFARDVMGVIQINFSVYKKNRNMLLFARKIGAIKVERKDGVVRFALLHDKLNMLVDKLVNLYR